MEFIKTEFKDLFIIKHNLYLDERGLFKENFRINKLEEFTNKKIKFCQQNSVKSQQNVLRGLHFQKEPYSQSKLISIDFGEILDIAVDIRRESKTYGKYFSYLLSSENHESIFIPKGFAHGYLTVSKMAIINYNVDSYYNQQMECGIAYNDDFLSIDWGVEFKNLIISDKDKSHKPFKW